MFLKKPSLFLTTVSLLGLMASCPLEAMELPDDKDQELKGPPVLQQQRAPIFSEEKDQQVWEHLQDFGLSSGEIDSLWDQLHGVMPKRRQALSLGTSDPHYIATGLWRIHQERTYLQPTTEKPLLFTTMASCLLGTEFSNKHQKLLLTDLSILTSLIRSNPYFTKLELFRAQLTDTHLRYMGIIPHVVELSLEENQITDKGLEILLEYPKLRILNLAKNNITPVGTKLLKDNKTLLHLNLYKNPIGDEGAEDLSHNTTLTYLDLRGERDADNIIKIGDKGAIALATNKTITDLRLRYNQITDIGAEAFLTCHHFTHLELAHNQINPDFCSFLENLMHSNAFYKTCSLHRGIFDLPLQKSRVRILSIDGGGIRGIMPAFILNYIAESLFQKTGFLFHFGKHLGLMAGTSTGGIITLGLGVRGERGDPKYIPQILLNLYKEKGSTIFPAPWSLLKFLGSSTYDPTGLEAYLKEFFQDAFLSESYCPTLITAFDLGQNKAHIPLANENALLIKEIKEKAVVFV